MSTIPAAAQKSAVRQQQVRRSHPRPRKTQKRVTIKRHKARTLPEIPFPVFVLGVSVITVGMIVNVAQQALVSQTNYQIEMLKKDIQLAQQAQDKLLAEQAILQSPQRIESVAMNRLSMVKAPKVSYMRVVGVPTTEQTKAKPIPATRASVTTAAIWK